MSSAGLKHPERRHLVAGLDARAVGNEARDVVLAHRQGSRRKHAAHAELGQRRADRAVGLCARDRMAAAASGAHEKLAALALRRVQRWRLRRLAEPVVEFGLGTAITDNAIQA